MSTLPDPYPACNITVTDPAGTAYLVDRLPRRPGQYAKGYRMTMLGRRHLASVFFVHQLPGGLVECDCSAWTQERTCEHCRLLTAAGLVDDPAEAREGVDVAHGEPVGAGFPPF